MFAAQPYIRSTVPSEKVDGENIEQTTENEDATPLRPGSPAPNTNVAAKCSFSGTTSCGSIAALRCSAKACLVHCRQIGAVASGMDPDEAGKQAVSGGLVGQGCEAHEAKFQARKEQVAEKRKNRSELKVLSKKRKLDMKEQKLQLPEAEEERLVAQDV